MATPEDREPALIGPGSLRRRGRVLDALVRSGSEVHHYRRRLDRPDRPWTRLGRVATDAQGGPASWHPHPGTSIPGPPIPGTVPFRRGDGSSAPGGRFLSAEGTVPPSPQPGLPDGCPQVVAGEWALVEEQGWIFGYHLAGGVWERDSCLRSAGEPTLAEAGPESVKLAQVSGERDATPTPWGERLPTLSASVSSAGILGTDLGVRVEHAGATLLLFGDTHWRGRPWLRTRDAIAEVTADGPRPGLPGVRFHDRPLKLVGAPWRDRVTMREYDVPLDGFSHSGRLYAFFSSNHGRHRRVMGRSVLAVALDEPPFRRRRPVRFQVLGTFSERHFMNVSVQLRPAAEVPGCGPAGEVLLVWGTGPYRASEVRLALFDQEALGRIAAGRAPAGVRYWAGSGWSPTEADAVPLFGPAALGELSVRWVEAAGRYLLLAASPPEDPIGNAITLRTATQPWGPWTPRRRLLDWVATGMAHQDPNTRFIKAVAGGDQVGDRIFPAQARATGAAYAPYFFDAAVADGELVLRYLLSTWNPYQVVLLRHRLPLDLS